VPSALTSGFGGAGVGGAHFSSSANGADETILRLAKGFVGVDPVLERTEMAIMKCGSNIEEMRKVAEETRGLLRLSVGIVREELHF
jgi:hypothetical protein